MANGTFYVDAVNGSDANDGLSEANAKQTLAAGVALFSGGGNKLHVQATGNYVLTTSVALSTAGDTTNGRNIVEGYTTTPGARDGRPTITSATSSVNLFTLTTSYNALVHLRLTHTGGTRGNGVHFNGSAESCLVEECDIDGCLDGIHNPGYLLHGLSVLACRIRNGTRRGIDLGYSRNQAITASEINDNASDGIRMISSNGNMAEMLFDRCLIDGNGGYGINEAYANTSTLNQLRVHHCILEGNTLGGIGSNSASGVPIALYLLNSIFYGNGGYGISFTGSTAERGANVQVNRCNAYGSNTSGARNNLLAGQGDVTLTADPFVDRASRNFALNDTAGGGALLRAVGFPGLFPGGLTESFADIGAAQTEMPSNADIADAVWTYGERTLTG